MPDDKKFDHVLDAAERERYLPTGALVEALGVDGGARVIDYGAGTGRVARAVAVQLGEGGQVFAVEESEEIARAGFATEPLALDLPFHFPLRASTTKGANT